MSFNKIINIFSVYILIFVILSGYTYGKLRHRQKRAHSDEVEDVKQHLREEESKGSGESSPESIDEGRVSTAESGDSHTSGDKSKGTSEKSEHSGSSSSEEVSAESNKGSKTPSPPWKKGTVPYRIDKNSYDNIIIRRIREAMKAIEAASCVIFKNMSEQAVRSVDIWLHITNPDHERDCVHETRSGGRGEAVMVLGFECMQKQDITHALLHALGFKDEVTHPQRDSYVRVLWENIQPKYHPLFAIQNEPSPYQLVEYDTMSVMHFHDRAFSSNGGATVTPLISGLLINPSEGLSQLDIMKLRLAFGHECNKRKVDDLLETCKSSLLGTESQGGDSDTEESESSHSKSKEHISKKHNKEPDNKKSDEDNRISANRSEDDGTDSGSDGVAIIDITTRGTTTKSKTTSKDQSKQELSGSKFGVLGQKKRRGRRNLKSEKSTPKAKKQIKTKKQTKTRQSKKQAKSKRQEKSKRSTSKNQTKRHSRKGNKNKE